MFVRIVPEYPNIPQGGCRFRQRGRQQAGVVGNKVGEPVSGAGLIPSISTDVNSHQKGLTAMAQQTYDWAAIAKDPRFIELHHKKSRFLFGWWIFSSVYYFLLPIGAAYAPDLFKIQMIGRINFGYVFALSQFFVSWWLALYYAKVANRDFDRMTRELIQELG
jgi:uncharacterized membrane protein (DUF485 family)